MSATNEHVIAVIPAYNEARHVGAVVRSALTYVRSVVVVDDGSTDATAAEAERAGASVLRHIVNRGLGGALRTGIRAANLMGATAVVTLDGDGQHETADIPAVLEPVVAGTADFVIGCRLIDPRGMPFHRRIANRIADMTTLALFGVNVRDTQSGFRAFSRAAAGALDIRSSRMEVSTEVAVQIVRKGMRLAYVPITVRYTEYSLSKGQGFLTGVQTLGRLVLRRMR